MQCKRSNVKNRVQLNRGKGRVRGRGRGRLRVRAYKQRRVHAPHVHGKIQTLSYKSTIVLLLMSDLATINGPLDSILWEHFK